MLSHCFIGHQHKGLNHALSNSPLTQDNIHWPAFFVDHDFGFIGVKVKRTAFKAHAFQNLMQLDHAINTGHNGLELLSFFLISSNDVVDITVGHAKGRLDNSLCNSILDHAPLGINLHDSRLGKPIHIGIERADSVGQALWQHGHYAVGHIDRGCPIEGFLVQLRAFFDIVGHICDMDTKLKVAIFQALDMDSIIQVLGIRSIDGKGNLFAQVQTSFQITLSRCVRNSLGLFQDLFWKLRDNVHGLQHFQHINARVVDMTDYIDQTGHKEIVFLSWIFVNSDLEHLCAI